MTDSVAGVALAAGAGLRLRPLTRTRPKVLCPVANRPLIDHALARFDGVTRSVAVNVHHGRALLESHLAGRVHLSLEQPVALGTAGALGRLREWIDGRPVIAVNADTWCPAPVGALLDGWDGERTRVLLPHGQTFGPGATIAGTLLPWRAVAPLDAVPAGLYETAWAGAVAAGTLDVVTLPPDTPCHDCGTPRRYLDANLATSGGASVVGHGAVVEGSVERSVLWAGAHVGRRERLVDAIRAGDRTTVLVR